MTLPGLAEVEVIGLNVEGIAAYMNAKGNIYAKNKIIPFAYGGIVSKPTLFPMANGAGLMGELGRSDHAIASWAGWKVRC